MKKQILELTDDERVGLRELVAKGHAPGWRLRRAQCLLACDQSAAGLGWPDKQVAEAYNCSVRSVEGWRRQAASEGVDAALTFQPRSQPMHMHSLTGEDEARLVALACSTPPQGASRWSLRLLASRLIELEIVGYISYETVRQSLKKTNFSLGAK
jgi:transposase